MGDTMGKYFYSFLIYCIFVLLIIPVVIIGISKERFENINAAGEDVSSKDKNFYGISLKPFKENEVIFELGEKTILEEYIIGVVAAEMPALFNMEALRAQAVAARTYAINQMAANNTDIEGMIFGGSQAYNTIEEMKRKWGNNFDEYYEKIEIAVLSTATEIIVYNDEPILAVFHAISRGKTETSDNIWSQSLPYLKSVESEMDVNALEYIHDVKIPVKTVAALLQEADSTLKLYDGNLKEQMQVVSKTEAGYIDTIQVGNVTFSGRQIREILELRSTDFTVKQEGTDMIFTTSGYGHGAGMSQYGANFMAEDGKTYKEILEHYYFDIQFRKIT